MLDPSDIEKKFFNLLEQRGIELTEAQKEGAISYIAEPKQSFIIAQLIQNEEELMSGWNRKRRLMEIELQAWNIPNATVGADYSAGLDTELLKIEDLQIDRIEGMEGVDLKWNANSQLIHGVPSTPGTFELTVRFSLKSDNEANKPSYYSKKIHFVVNPDPRSLWKNIASDKEAPFWKDDDHMASGPLGARQFVACSKRGRSHQHKGTFRDDHYAYATHENGWSIVSVSDGAGSAKYSREGSKIACNAVVDYFQSLADGQEENALSRFNDLLATKDEMPSHDEMTEISVIGKRTLLYPAAVHAHNDLIKHVRGYAERQPDLFETQNIVQQLADFHATLIFCLFKQFDFGTICLTFGVGDCPIAVTYHNQDGKLDVKLLNLLDVGDYGGGTRFITQPRIFDEQKAEVPMANRFSVNVFPDFLYMFLMTDGIYDPKFEVEANLEKAEKWVGFISDLAGENEDQAMVEFEEGNQEIAEQLSIWMDFFSKGNHDDRTLAVIY